MIKASTNILSNQKEISIFRTAITKEKDIKTVEKILNIVVRKNE